MNETISEKLYIGPDTVMKDFDVSRPKAYAIIHSLNEDLRREYPSAIVVAGKVNRFWYDEACLKGLITEVELMGYEQILTQYNDILLPEDVQEILHTGRNTVYNYLAKGTIKSIRIGGKYRIPKLYLLEFIYPDIVFDRKEDVIYGQT